MTVEGVALFDLDNTLVDRQRAFARWARAFCAVHGLGGADSAWLIEADDDGFTPRPVLFEEVRRRFGLCADVEELVADYRRTQLVHYRPDEVTSGALGRLRAAGWRIGVVTNGPLSQHEKVSRAGLEHLVDAVCVSEEVGVSKPDPRIFEEALDRCDVGSSGAPERWMIGDAPRHDVLGGRSAGLATMWLHRGRTWPEPDYRPDLVVASVAEAVERLLARRDAVTIAGDG